MVVPLWAHGDPYISRPTDRSFRNSETEKGLVIASAGFNFTGFGCPHNQTDVFYIHIDLNIMYCSWPMVQQSSGKSCRNMQKGEQGKYTKKMVALCNKH